MAVERASAYLVELGRILNELPVRQIEQMCDILYQAHLKDRTLFIFGNGGSAALASHMACDLGKGTFAPNHIPLPGVKRFKVLSLTDNVPMLSAWANDTAYEDIFAEQLANFIQAEDVAFGISGSGNSPNVLKALRLAREKGALTLGLTGFQGGKMKDLLHCGIVVPSNSMQQIEDIHLVVMHLIFLELQHRLAHAKAQPVTVLAGTS